LDFIFRILKDLGSLKAAYITGDYARGIDSGIIDLVIVGEVNEAGLLDLIRKTEGIIERKIRLLLLKPDEEKRLAALKSAGMLPVWTANGTNGFFNGGNFQ
jgi:hypothetical protein